MGHAYMVAIVSPYYLCLCYLELTLKAQSHHIWLRDHCRCAQCFHPVTKQRLVNTFEVRSSGDL